MPRAGQEQSVHLWSCSPGFGVFSRKSVHVSTAPAGPRRFNSRQPQSGCESSEMPQQESCRVGVKQAPMHTRCLGRTSEKRSGAQGRILKKKKKKIPFNAINIYTKSKEVAEFKLVLYESYSISLTPVFISCVLDKSSTKEVPQLCQLLFLYGKSSFCQAALQDVAFQRI